jgi:hypothetical protein
MEADHVVRMDTTPVRLELRLKGTGTVLESKELFDKDGNPITAANFVTTPIARLVKTP